MTTLTASLPRNPNRFILAFIVAVVLLAVGLGLGVALTRSAGMGEVTVKPCATCPTCPCKPLLGGPRCGCPN